MRTIFYLLQKELLQIFRDKVMLVIIFAVPLIQLFVLAYAATFELKNAEFHLVDFDQSETSRRLAASFEATGTFSLTGTSFDINQGLKDILNQEAKMVMVIPEDFGKQLTSGQKADIQFIISAVDGSTAGLIQSYSQAIVRQFNRQIQPEIKTVSESPGAVPVSLIPLNRYNQNLDYITYMVPGIITILVTLICLILSVLSIVRERELGTIEQLNVTPIKKYQFIAGKLISTWGIAIVILTVALAIAFFWFGIPFRGNIMLIYGTAVIYLLGIQGLGLFISSLADTQQQAMFINFFCVMIFILMGGIFTPVESMPEWAQQVNLLNPIAYFGKIMRMVLLKGSGWSDIQNMVSALTLMAAVLLPLSILNYRKRTG